MATLQKSYQNSNKSKYLTQRQLEVLKYLILGYTAKKIAISLDISYRTVENYIEILKLKLQCNSKGEMIEKVILQNLVDVFSINKDVSPIKTFT